VRSFGVEMRNFSRTLTPEQFGATVAIHDRSAPLQPVPKCEESPCAIGFSKRVLIIKLDTRYQIKRRVKLLVTAQERRTG